jgi:hypothetical protein
LLPDCEGENMFEYLSDETNPVDLRQMRKELMTNDKTTTCIVMGETSTLPLKLKVWWQPPQHDVDVEVLTGVRVAAINSNTIPDLDVHIVKNRTVRYKEMN